MDWQWESIRDEAFIDVERIIDNFVGDKLAPAERWQLTTAFLDLADQLSRTTRRRRSTPWASRAARQSSASGSSCRAPGAAWSRRRESTSRCSNAP
jgi:hypothetical protein